MDYTKKYKGNTWGDCGNGTGAVGCGRQETFRNCADVAIITNTQGFGPAGLVPSAPNHLDKIISKYGANSSQNTQDVNRYVLMHCIKI